MRPSLLLFASLWLAGTAAAQEARPLPAQGDQATDNEMPATEGDGVALAQLIAFDAHAAAAAEVARRRNPSQPVADYATTEADEHAANRTRSEEVLRAIGLLRADTPELTALADAREDQREALADQDGDEFTRAFIAATIQDHAEALAQIDQRLLRAANNDDVTAHLNATRAMIARHLDAARALVDRPDR